MNLPSSPWIRSSTGWAPPRTLPPRWTAWGAAASWSSPGTHSPPRPRSSASSKRRWERATPDVRRHPPACPESGIASAAQLARDCQADLLISLGGGSPIDAAKAVAQRLSSGASYLPQIAIPTTLSAAEFSGSAGYTDETSKSKTGISGRELTPRVVILDPEMTVGTPLWLWLSSGIRSLDHAVETLYAPGYHPVNDVLALQAIVDLFACLPGSKAEPADLALRQRCQQAAWMSYFAPAASGAAAGLSHTIGKRIGATYNVPHGVTSCILLPHVMRLKAQNPADAAHLAPMARALDRAAPSTPDREAALSAADAVTDLVHRLDLPSRLREFDVPQGDSTISPMPRHQILPSSLRSCKSLRMPGKRL